MPPTIETDLREIFAKFDQRFDRLEQRLEGMQRDLADLKTSQQQDLADLKTSQQKDLTDIKLSQAQIRGDIQTLDEKVSGFGKRLENQEFVNRSVFAAILVTILAGALKFFGFFPNP